MRRRVQSDAWTGHRQSRPHPPQCPLAYQPCVPAPLWPRHIKRRKLMQTKMCHLPHTSQNNRTRWHDSPETHQQFLLIASTPWCKCSKKTRQIPLSILKRPHFRNQRFLLKTNPPLAPTLSPKGVASKGRRDPRAVYPRTCGTPQRKGTHHGGKDCHKVGGMRRCMRACWHNDGRRPGTEYRHG